MKLTSLSELNVNYPLVCHDHPLQNMNLIEILRNFARDLKLQEMYQRQNLQVGQLLFGQRVLGLTLPARS